MKFGLLDPSLVARWSLITERTAAPSFFQRTRAARKVMVLDLGFLGDTVHLLPSLWMLRQAYPEAELHVIVARHVVSLLECAPWVDSVWGYPRFPKHASLAENIRTVRRLRQECFQVVINLNGSDRSSWLTWLSGAPERLGRLPVDGGPWLWRSLFTEIVEHSFLEEQAFEQKWHCLRKAGFPGEQPEFHAQIDAKHLEAGAGFHPADAGTFFHCSPFTTDDDKELPLETTATLIDLLQERFPEKRVALSCAPTARERGKLEALLAKVRRKPWRVLAGTLNLVQLAALIQRSALHLSGDTGPLHLALMTGVPTVSWFRTAERMKPWMPSGPCHRTLLGTGLRPGSLHGITPETVVDAVQALSNQGGGGGPR